MFMCIYMYSIYIYIYVCYTYVYVIPIWLFDSPPRTVVEVCSAFLGDCLLCYQTRYIDPIRRGRTEQVTSYTDKLLLKVRVGSGCPVWRPTSVQAATATENRTPIREARS